MMCKEARDILRKPKMKAISREASWG